MDRDGTQAGFDTELLSAVAEAAPVPVIASGGAGTLDHFAQAVTAGHADAVLAASVFHDGVYSIAQVKDAMARSGVPVRV
jgi:cyclase